MKVFFDTEFTGLHQETTLISIGLIDENENRFYAEFMDFDWDQCDDWILKNVINNTVFQGRRRDDNGTIIFDFQFRNGPRNVGFYGSTNYIKNQLEEWFIKYNHIEMWSDCLSYDWVLFNDIWGSPFNIPNNIYYIPFDICTLFKIKGVDPDINREEHAFGKAVPKDAIKHRSEWDAFVIKKCYEKLMEGA